jgi:hypothetical protein
MRYLLSSAGLVLLGAGLIVLAQEAKKPVVQTRTITLREREIPLSKALGEVQRQLGIEVKDARNEKDSSIALDLASVSFWRAIDTIAATVKAKAILSRDGTVALAPLRHGDRLAPTSYDGDFRFRILRVSSSRQLDTDEGSCVVTIEIVWTPTLRPLFLNSQAHEVRFVDQASKTIALRDEGGSLTPVDGRFQFTLDVSLPRFPREQAKLSQFDGKLLTVVPSKFLTFRFDADLITLKEAVADGAIRRLVQEDVICRIDRVVLGKDRWSVQIGIEYPAGGKILESFQAGSLVVQNELVLIGEGGKRTVSPSSLVVQRVSSRRAEVTYHFTDRAALRRSSGRDWKLHYRAPARIIEVPVAFRFRDVPLP